MVPETHVGADQPPEEYEKVKPERKNGIMVPNIHIQDQNPVEISKVKLERRNGLMVANTSEIPLGDPQQDNSARNKELIGVL